MINKKRYLCPLAVSLPGGVDSVYTLRSSHATVAAVNYAFYTHLTKHYSNSAEHTFLLITTNVQASTDTDTRHDTVRDQTLETALLAITVNKLLDLS